MTINRLYFMQHGLAVDKTENPERPLSVPGIEQTRLVAAQLCKQQVTISKIFHSRKLRASQTAKIVADKLHLTALSAVDYLSPNSEISITTQFLNTDSALYIGHLPHLDKLTSYLLVGDENRNLIHFQNSAILCIEWATSQYQLQWYLTPALLTHY